MRLNAKLLAVTFAISFAVGFCADSEYIQDLLMGTGLFPGHIGFYYSYIPQTYDVIFLSVGLALPFTVFYFIGKRTGALPGKGLVAMVLGGYLGFFFGIMLAQTLLATQDWVLRQDLQYDLSSPLNAAELILGYLFFSGLSAVVFSVEFLAHLLGAWRKGRASAAKIES